MLAFTAFTGRSAPVVDWETSLEGSQADHAAMVHHMRQALAMEAGFPFGPAAQLDRSLGWHDGATTLQGLACAELAIRVSRRTAFVLPELTPVCKPDGVMTWIDALLPCSRRIGVDPPASVPPRPKPSVAIVHQAEGEFASLAQAIDRVLRAAGLITDCYSGAVFAGDSITGRMALQDVFGQHRAVLFLGHYAEPEAGQGGGWQLTNDHPLRMKDLGDLLGVHWDTDKNCRTRYGRANDPRGLLSVPELVIACTCYGAGRDPDWAGNLSYPEMFLTAGVRHFVGPWMDVVFKPERMAEQMELIVRMVTDFLIAWMKDPDNACQHLYLAKDACKFHPLTSLFQLYDGTPVRPSDRSPAVRSAMVSGLRPGDRIGDYVLGPEISADGYARTFWAQRGEDSAHGALVQVLADELQEQPGFAEEAKAGIERIRQAELGPLHLLPTECSTADWSPDGRALRPLLIVVYERPPDDRPEYYKSLSASFSTLRGETTALTPQHFLGVLEICVEVSALLAELHAKQITHGNLCPSSVLLHTGPGAPTLLLKDAWLWQARHGRRTDQRYAPPTESFRAETADERKQDCWSFGVIVYELTSGRTPFDTTHPPQAGLRESLRVKLGPQVPEALDRIAAECLTPSAHLRPSAQQISQRLSMAMMTGGVLLSDFVQHLDVLIQAGNRLFAVQTEDLDELELALRALARAPRPAGRIPAPAPVAGYRLLVAEEGEGLRDQTGARILPWVGAADMARQLGGTPTPDQVAAVNAAAILDRFFALVNGLPPNQVALLLLRGSRWWYIHPSIGRVLREYQARATPACVVLVADRLIYMDEDLQRAFRYLPMPAPPPAVLFERIVAFARREWPDPEALPPEQAVELAVRMYPCTLPRLETALRGTLLETALRTNVLDTGALVNGAVRHHESERARVFRQLGTAVYTEPDDLTDPSHLGYPPGLQEELQAWGRHYQAQVVDASVPIGRTRLLLWGPSGCGKTCMAEALAAFGQVPLVRLDGSACLRGRLGESETALRLTLAAVQELRAAVFLVDGVDRLFVASESAADQSAVRPTLTRMSGILLHWMDAAMRQATDIVVVLTTADPPASLGGQWRRRVQWEIELPLPVGNNKLDYRQEIFAAVFRRFQLRHLADDPELTGTLAGSTDPEVVGPVPSAVGRRSRGKTLAGHRVRLETPAEIAYWAQEHLALFGSDPDAVCRPDFWLDAADARSREEVVHGTGTA